LFFSRLPIAVLLILVVSGCSAQTGTAASDPELNRRIEIMLRSRYGRIPQEAAFSYGERKPSEMAGYDVLPITLSIGANQQTLEFLISRDNKTLARLEKFDVSKLPDQDLNIKGRPVRGNPDAKVTIINFDDFQCPYCAMRAAVNANCIAGQNGKAYWDFADKVHGSLKEISTNDKGDRRTLVESQNRLDGIAQDISKKHGLDANTLDACIKKQDDAAVQASMGEGEKLAVDSTPTLFVNGERVAGAIPFSDFQNVLDRALIAAGVTPPARRKPAPAVPETKPQEKK
jgi:protein-disulfide isomerase